MITGEERGLDGEEEEEGEECSGTQQIQNPRFRGS